MAWVYSPEHSCELFSLKRSRDLCSCEQTQQAAGRQTAQKRQIIDCCAARLASAPQGARSTKTDVRASVYHHIISYDVKEFNPGSPTRR